MASPLDLKHGLTCVKHVTTASLWGIGRRWVQAENTRPQVEEMTSVKYCEMATTQIGITVKEIK